MVQTRPKPILLILDQHVYSCNLVIEFNICISDILNQYVLLAKANTQYLKSWLMSCEYIDRPCSGLITRSAECFFNYAVYIAALFCLQSAVANYVNIYGIM